MTDFKKASKGVGKIFKGEILELIGTILLFASLGILAVTGILSDSEAYASTTTGAIIGGACGVVAVVLMIISMILEIVGVGQTGKQNITFKVAFVLLIANIIVSLVGGILEACFPSVSIISQIVLLVGRIVDIAVTILVIGGCADLCKEKGDMMLAQKATSLTWTISILYLAGCAFQFVPQAVSTFSKVVQIICIVLYLVCEVAAYCMYLSTLRKTQQALAA